MSDLAAVDRGERASQQLSDLKRMRRMALGLLALMGALFVAASLARRAWPWLDYPRAFAEAGIVGACADWFAVVALFRHPFGIPIPHTAIVPRQKQRIGEALGRFITNNFLAPDEVTPRIERVDAAGWLADWLREPDNVRLVVSRSQGLGSPLLDLLREEQVRSFSRTAILRGVDSIALAPLLARGLSTLIAQGHFDTAFDFGVESARGFLETHRKSIRQRVVKNHVRWIPGWIDVRLADAILAEVLATLAAAGAAADHPWRIECRAAAARLVARLADDPQVSEQCERFKGKFLEQSVVESYLDWLIGEVETRLRAELDGEANVVSSGLEHALVAVGRWLDSDEHIRTLINDWAHRLAVNAVVASREEIGAFVAGVVERWDTDTLVGRLELQVGKDLQYIRINGTLVGGLVGLIIFTVARLFGQA